ncbi:MAG: Metallo-beta-lactamase [Candidatus Woesebacteria bacterium GW2011_GWA2_40_7]|uniref:Metallo-beta-lactamase n=3 Tax=Candidatus Woeseibacteriota TaxID=1752722 RepID=A0A0G0LM39_9BACT|nr:MAG: Metallo-beta-lactamase [Candidatus Woesebacteria bacterium GW2011_GWB1_39_10]KKR73514.1 MAG: Metallo-beta-lactamase [Candidatus Woesebacteria bacterium GW2011_GWA2_40_7]KKS91042.1 MAG: Metallo-beta-lactamase [Candidatus Woesebacteria bacterium GW2011_GWA1_43_12]
MNSLKFIALSGTTGVTENLYVYEYGNDMIVVDCGVGFPDSEMFGVDLVIPDFTYVVQNKHKLRGVLISHGHEDHLGAIPFLLKEVNTPVYATKLVAGFIQEKLIDSGMDTKNVKVFDPDHDVLTLGVFKVTPFRVAHSVPDGVGFCIDSPEGKLFHVPDYKFDWTPVDGRPFDVAKVATLASGGALALASDSLGATSPGYTESEKAIEGRIEQAGREATGKIYLTTISSNISRMQQTINAAAKLGRKVVLIGRSIERKAEIARQLGYIFYPKDVVIRSKQAAKLPPNKVLYIISGCYGQSGSALYRLATGEHDFLTINKGDMVIFSADPGPPGSAGGINFLVDKFIESDIDVHYYDMQEDLHVSGHGSIKDIEMLFALVKPKYYIPIGGTIRHMRAYGLIAQSMGASEREVLELTPGQIVEYNNQNARIAGRVPVKEVLIDGLGVGDVGNTVLRDRHILSKEGIVITIIHFDRNRGTLLSPPEIISRGFVFEQKYGRVLDDASRDLARELQKKKSVNSTLARNTAIDFLERYFAQKTGRRPMILPVVVEV